MQMKMEATTSDSLDAQSSIKNDLNFFKEWLATIDPSVFGAGTQELQDSDSAEDTQVKKTSKKQERNQKFNKTSKKQTEPEPETEEESYSKIKEKQKHKNSKMAKQRKQKTDARLLNIITPRQEDLQQKLRARIEALQGKRGLSIDEQKEKKKLKRKESLLKLKLRKKFEKQNKNKGNLAVQKETVVNGAVAIGSPNSKPVKPVYNKEGKLVFSKFDFTEAGGKDRGKSNLLGKDYKRLLEKIEKRKEHVEKVKEKDAEKGKQVETKMAWETAIHRAQGQKVKDDPALVKKAMKKKEKIRKQKSKQWSQRDSQTKKRMETKIEKRTKNIEERKQQKKDKKNKRAKKKGRLVAGF